jgi:hypothetical protein
MKTKHTTGDWQPDIPSAFVKIENPYRVICQVNTNRYPDESDVEETQANIKLIAAAPDLLSVLLIINGCSNVTTKMPPGMKFAMNAAIRKATL